MQEMEKGDIDKYVRSDEELTVNELILQKALWDAAESMEFGRMITIVNTTINQIIKFWNDIATNERDE